MDNRLVLAVLSVTLAWLSVGTYADSHTTVAVLTVGDVQQKKKRINKSRA